MSQNILLHDVIKIARSAGCIIMEYFNHEISVMKKIDGSPVTAADRDAESLIIPALRKLTPTIPIVAEESVEAGNIPTISDNTFWLVDPLDGTKEFINRSSDFTVNIGLIEKGQPSLGVVLTPCDNIAWAGVVSCGAFTEDRDGKQTPISVREPIKNNLTVVASRSHRSPELEEYISALHVKQSTSRGSSLKFCIVASGDADIYPRLGTTMEWDTAAGHAILLAAGGRLTNFDDSDFEYGKPGFRNGWFIAYGR